MGDKKRKDLPVGSEMPKKKSRKRAADVLSDDETEKNVQAMNVTNGDGEELNKEATKHNKKKSKKSKKSKEVGEALTADGVNGVVEHAGDENVEPTHSSMQAEAQRTVDDEMKEEYGNGQDGGDEEDGDMGAALLAGFDSDASDPAEDKGLDVTNLGAIPNYKKTKKKLSKIHNKGDADTPGAIYIGRIPHGFYEPQMREYFSQFGDIIRLRLSRNKRTGASKHFAFIEFKSEEVAKIAAETMDTYLMFGHILKCKFAPAESLHADVWKGANKKYRKVPHAKLEKAKLEAPKSADKWRQKIEREEKKREKNAKDLKEKMGYDSPAVKLTDPVKALEANKLDAENLKEIEDAAVEEPAIVAAIEVPPKAAVEETPVLEDKGKSLKKDKNSKKEGKDEPAKANTIEEPADESVLAAKEAPAIEVKQKSSKEKKSRKEKKDAKDSVTLQEKPADELTPAATLETESDVNKKESKKDKKAKKPKKVEEVQATTSEEPADESLLAVTEAENEAVETSIQVPEEAEAVAQDDWEDDSDDAVGFADSDSDDEPTPTESKPASKVKAKTRAPPSGEVPMFKNPKIPRDATGKENHRDAKGKYIPPLQRKQLARAKWAKENPEAHKAGKKAKVTERKQKRMDKKDKRQQKLIEKFGAKNMKGGANYKSSKKNKVKVKSGHGNE